MKNFYEILGIDKTVNDNEQIRKAAWQKWEEIKTVFTEQQRELLNAYDCLINPSKRQLYDSQLAKKLEDTMDPELLRKLNLLGFLWFGDWILQEESFIYECHYADWLKETDVLYAFVTSESVGYIGKVGKSAKGTKNSNKLGNRLDSHKNKLNEVKPETSSKKGKMYVPMVKAIQQSGEVVRIFVMKPTESHDSDRYGSIDLVGGLEIPLAKEFKALWNKIGHTGKGIKEEEERIKKERLKKTVMYDEESMNKIMEGVEKP